MDKRYIFDVKYSDKKFDKIIFVIFFTKAVVQGVISLLKRFEVPNKGQIESYLLPLAILLRHLLR